MTFQTVKVPIASPVFTGVDGAQLNDLNARLIDAYRDEFGATVSRPGLSELYHLELGSDNPVDALYYWPHKNCVLALQSGKLTRINYMGGVASVADLGTQLNLKKRATFATDGDNVFVANGGRIFYCDEYQALAALADADAPTSVTHVAYLDGYILANEANSNRFRFADVNSPQSWSALNFASAAGNADYITALTVLNREIYLFGPLSMEIWENDGTTPFSRVPGGFINTGCSAPYSIVNTEEALYWLDNRRHFVRFSGRNIERISSPYDRIVQDFASVTDCIGDRIEIGSKEFFVWSFPGADRTIVFNASDNDWSDWGRFDSDSMSYHRWIGNCFCYPQTWGVHLVGSCTEGKVHTLSFNHATDNGGVIRPSRLTGHIDYGTLKEKCSNEFRIRLKRGQGMASGIPKLMVRWCDNGKRWSNTREISLGSEGEYELVGRLNRTGMYRTRQYEFSCSDPIALAFLSAEEDIEVRR